MKALASTPRPPSVYALTLPEEPTYMPSELYDSHALSLSRDRAIDGLQRDSSRMLAHPCEAAAGLH